MEGHPYLRLLRAYLEEFLPRDGGEGGSAAAQAGANLGRCALRMHYC